MSFVRHFWNALLDLAEVVWSLEGNDIPDVESTDCKSTQPVSSPALQSLFKQDCTPDSERSEAAARIETYHSSTKQHAPGKDAKVEEIRVVNESEMYSTNSTELSSCNDAFQAGTSSLLTEDVSQKLDTQHINRGLLDQNRRLHEDNVRHLRWQDEASMTIREMNEEIQNQRQGVRAAKKAAVRATAAMCQQIGQRKRQIGDLKLEKIRMSDENSRATEAHKKSLKEVEAKLKNQREEAKRAAAAAERRIAEVQAEHDGEMLGAKVEIETVERRINHQGSEIKLLRDEAEDARQDRRRAIEAKNDLYRAKLDADREIERLQAENNALELRRKEVESKVSGAEGRARGLQDLLHVSEKSAERWKRVHDEAQKAARDRILSAYAIMTPQIQEKNQMPSTTAPASVESSLAAELLKENGKLRDSNRDLTDKIAESAQALEAEKQGKETWEKEIRRQCDEEVQKALAQARVKDEAISEQAAREQRIRRECQEEKEKAFSEERDSIRVQWRSWEMSLRGQFAVKLRSHTSHELQKSLRRTSTEFKMRSKVEKCPVKCVVRQAVSRAVEVERSLIQKNLQSQFQTELSNYKSQFESEHGKARTKASAQNDRTVLQQEINKRDKEIESHKANLNQANKENRESEADLKKIKEENERLSREVIAYKSQNSVSRQVRTDAQVTLMTQDFVRASQLLAELAAMGLDQFHRKLLDELLFANKVIVDLRSAIEDDQLVDYEAFAKRMQIVVAGSDPFFERMDPRERPTLHAQLGETYSVIGDLTNILKAKPGDTAREDLLDRIYRDKGKGKERQGTLLRSIMASEPPAGSNSGQSAAPSSQVDGSNSITSNLNVNHQTGFSDTAQPMAIQVLNGFPPTSTSNSNATQFQYASEEMDSAAAHALQGLNEMGPGTSEVFDLDSIDWTDALWRDFDPEAELPSNNTPAM